MDAPLEETLGVRFAAYLDSPLDYKKHRALITRRIVKLRHELSLVNRDTARYTDKQRAILGDDYARDPRHGLLLMLLAERDLVYAQEIKDRMETTPNAASLKPLMLSRIKRAVSHSLRVLALLGSNESPAILLQCYIYAAMAAGQYAISKKRWNDALYAYSVARCAVDFVSAQATVDKYSLLDPLREVLRELFLIIDASLNLLISQTRDNSADLTSLARNHCRDDRIAFLKPMAPLIESLDPAFVLPATSNTLLVKEIHWRGHSASVNSDEIAFMLSSIESLTKNADTQSVQADEYDGLIAAWLQVLQHHRSQDNTSHDADDLQSVQDSAILLTYIQYNLLFTRLKRDTIILASLSHDESRLRDASRVYTGMLSVVREIQELPGVFGDEELFASLESLLEYYTSQQQCQLALLLSAAGRAIDLLRVLDHVSRRNISPFTVSFPYNLCTNKEVEQFKRELASQVVKAHILAQLATQSQSPGLSMVENIYTFPSGDLSSAVPLCPSQMIRPVLCKPVLFDIAYNYINYDLDKRGNASQTWRDQSQDPAADKKRGFFGMFGGR